MESSTNSESLPLCKDYVLEDVPEAEKTYGHRCIELLQKYLPDITQKEGSRLLFERTAYPFREIEFIEENIRYIRDHGEAAAADRIYKSIDEEMEKTRVDREKIEARDAELRAKEEAERERIKLATIEIEIDLVKG
jgi:hypothetical protein